MRFSLPTLSLRVASRAGITAALGINCRGSSNCVFFHKSGQPEPGGTGGLPGSEIKTLAKHIVEHDCDACGSVPVYFDQGDNDVSTHGQLAFNYVDRTTVNDGDCGSIKGKCEYE
ncbi:hypothetical protein MGN70_013844 [Eutypa lata]|nr:hypothetical protein MGN70_013844 [Eutypa lata]